MNINQRITELGPGGLPRYNKKCNELTQAVNWLLGMTTSNGKLISDGGRGPVINTAIPTPAPVPAPATGLPNQQVKLFNRTSGSQAILPNVLTTLTWDTVGFDNGGFSNLPSNNTRLVIPATGIYLYGFGIPWASEAAATSGTFRQASAVVNGTESITSLTPSLFFNYASPPLTSAIGVASSIDSFNAGDILTIAVSHDSTSNLHIPAGLNPYTPNFWCIRLI